MASFEEDTSGNKCSSHPAAVVPHFLASSNEETNLQRMKQLDLWYMGYQQKREKAVVYKSVESMARSLVQSPFMIHLVYCTRSWFIHMQRATSKELDRSIAQDTVKLPFSSIRFLGPTRACLSDLAMLRFSAPADGMPCVRDWTATFESIMMAGLDLSREPLSINARHSVGSIQLYD